MKFGTDVYFDLRTNAIEIILPSTQMTLPKRGFKRINCSNIDIIQWLSKCTVFVDPDTYAKIRNGPIFYSALIQMSPWEDIISNIALENKLENKLNYRVK